MLILSRKPGESIVFPRLGVTLKFLHAQGRRLRIGIEAPDSVEISRGEIVAGPIAMSSEGPTPTDRHEFRNRLHTAVLAMSLAQKQLEAGYNSQAETTLQQTVERLEALELELTPGSLVNAPADGRQLDVLIVEDDDNERALMRGLLELEGYAVATAPDGLAALDLVAKTRPRVVLLDMMMPRCDGPTAARRLRQMPGTPMYLWAVSGSSPESVGIAAGDNTALDGWFSKPLNPAHLVRQLKAIRQPAVSI